MKIHFFLLLTLLLFATCTPEIIPILEEKQKLTASPSWELLENYPIRFGRNDDVSFVTPKLGWTINSQGYLHKTTDGGESWELQFRKGGAFFRCLVFKDSLNGWLGTLGRDDKYLHSSDSVTLYETHDGGRNWQPTKFEGEYPKGLCGIQKVSDEVIVGCGRVRGPSYFIKTTDGGKTWQSQNLNHIAGSLIAPHFFDENRGILVGGTTRDKVECQSMILGTEDGGTTWDTLYISKQKGEYLWKISFPTEQIGYISVQRNTREGIYNFLKSTDGGRTWQEHIYTKEPYRIAQGIGFLNENIGWIGGSFKYSYETRDGGKSWSPVSTGKGINNFQFVDENTAYMVGRGIYKLNSLQPIPNGDVTTYYDNGNIQTHKNYQKGFLHGIATNYYTSGTIKNKGKYRKNLRHGVWKNYQENGVLQEKIKFVNGVAKIESEVLQPFEGVYKIDDNAVRFIFYKDGQLYSKRSDQSRLYKIYPEADNIFFYEHDSNLKITFIQAENSSKIAHSITYRPGREWVSKRLYGSEADLRLEKAKKKLFVE